MTPARLYRACEALAQIQLSERHGIQDTGRIPLDKLPHEFQQEWKPRARDGIVSVGLRDAYRLLQCLGDEMGKKFFDEGLGGDTSPLSSRNQSILAHGFTSVKKEVYDNLASAIYRLGEFTPESQPWSLPVI